MMLRISDAAFIMSDISIVISVKSIVVVCITMARTATTSSTKDMAIIVDTAHVTITLARSQEQEPQR